MNTAAFRPDIERLRSANHELRSPDRLRAHYILERELASRLRDAEGQKRSQLYGDLYTELFARLPDHPQHRTDPAKRQKNTENQAAFLKARLKPDDVFVEIGCGDAALTRTIAPYVHQAIAVDVTSSLIDKSTLPANVRFLKTSGTDIDLPEDCADIAYSNQLMEHLHPDDATMQLREIHRILKPGGRYICITPNRITGPHDISAYFGYEPAGFHLREYDHASLAAKFRAAGFRSSQAHLTVKGRHIAVPVAQAAIMEKLFLALPRSIRVRLTQYGPVKTLAGVTLIGEK